ncbi:hypothetical protein [uncultured Croceitalea sp.]|uniref:hypothetical protein n=1 Tax=uncultured Croceitalea sp. TaxID=1798908 RepID=UPI00374F16D3
MELIDKLVEFFKAPKEETKDIAPEGICALCWGHYAYDKKIRTVLKDKQIDVNNHRDSYMKVKKFLVEHVDGPKLKKGLIECCGKCDDSEKNIHKNN